MEKTLKKLMIKVQEKEHQPGSMTEVSKSDSKNILTNLRLRMQRVSKQVKNIETAGTGDSATILDSVFSTLPWRQLLLASVIAPRELTRASRWPGTGEHMVKQSRQVIFIYIQWWTTGCFIVFRLRALNSREKPSLASTASHEYG